MGDTTLSSAAGPAPETRHQYLDTLKLLLTVLVVAVHAAITYGATGSWFFHDPATNFPTSAALSIFNIYCQSFFMGLFFFISGLFTPRSVERKGPARFVLDRLVRLGIPLLVFSFVINPLTNYAASRAGHPRLGFETFLRMNFRGLRGMGTGPLWFVQTLLAFSIVAAIVMAVAPKLAKRLPQSGTPHPLRAARTFLSLVATGLGVGAVSFLVRQRFPLMTAVSNLQLGFFTQYVVCFVLGIAAYRRGFLDRLAGLGGRLWYWASLACALGLPVLLVAGGAFQNGLGAFTTGLRWQALAYALWEQVTGVVFSMALLAFARRHLDSPGPVVRLATRNAYVTYVFHAPVIAWIAYAWLHLHLPPAVKWLMLVAAGMAATVLLGELVLRRIPGVRRVMA